MRSHRPASSARLRLMTVLLLIGAAARIAPLTANRFHPDEALFATLARLVVSGRDPYLSTTTLLVDKPPLFYYILAGSISLAGGNEMAARLPGLFAGIITMALVARLAWQLWRSESAAWLALALTALSPFAILFAPTVFADSQFVMWLLASLVVVSAGRWGWSGLLFGLAVATKQNALFFLPLILMLGVVQNAGPERLPKSLVGSPGTKVSCGGFVHAWRWAWRFALTFGLVLVLMFLWDIARHGASSFWTAGALINNPGRLARSREVWPRAIEWLGWLHYLTALGWLNVLLAALVIVLAPLEVGFSPRTRGSAGGLALLAFMIGYLGLHWLVAFPVLDRYLLPAVPLIALLAGRAATLLGCFKPQITQIVRICLRSHGKDPKDFLKSSSCPDEATVSSKIRRLPGSRTFGVWLFRQIVRFPARWLLPLAIIVVLAGPAWKASSSAYPVGGDHGAFDGIDQAAAYLRKQPLGSVVYYRALGWMMDYYLFDAYLYPIWFETPAWLSEDLRAFGGTDTPRYLVLSKTESPLEVLSAVRGAGCRAAPVLEPSDRFGSRSISVYRLSCQFP